jgi:hypothetical protein
LGLIAGLIFFNDPFYAASIVNPTRAARYISLAFMANFVAMLMTFWLSVNLKITTPLEHEYQGCCGFF